MSIYTTSSSPLLFNSLPKFALACLAALGASAAFATDLTWKNIQFGGFASQGYLNSSANDYLGETKDGTFDFREYAANASWSTGKFRVGAQVFGQKLGDYGNDKIKLDWASVDYQAKQWFGLRAGRVKMPRGLYNEALDLDSVRPFVLLPQSVYDNRLRDFNASFDGGMAYGNVELRRFGSLDYRAFYGRMPIQLKSGATDYFNNNLKATNLAFKMSSVRGGTVFWNTPVAGLRTGYSYSAFDKLTSERLLTATTEYTKTAKTYERQLVSAEYTKGDWTFATEGGTEHALYDVSLRSLTTGAITPIAVTFRSQYFYVSAARRINKWLELGSYFSSSRDKQTSLFGSTTVYPILRQRDYAISARFDLTEHLIFKLEGHYMDGAGKIFDTPTRPQPVAGRDKYWNMVAAKIT
ncbi:MAG: hypothetical protein NTV51_15095, partial [Verrucomicrobia bacterium]|nr:hypothetical protein [Verrucomicrobiota bacterium]